MEKRDMLSEAEKWFFEEDENIVSDEVDNDMSELANRWVGEEDYDEEDVEDKSLVYQYYINLDERGEFSADVRDENGKPVYEIKSDEDGEIPEVVDGFMDSGDDINNLEIHLKNLNIIPDNAVLEMGN
jgi:hypothetical protein